MKRKTRPAEPEDDGRVIAPMDVDGMPWALRRADPPPAEEQPPAPQSAQEPLTREERRAFAWGALKAVFLVAGIFFLVYLAFILFATQVWFR